MLSVNVDIAKVSHERYLWNFILGGNVARGVPPLMDTQGLLKLNIAKDLSIGEIHTRDSEIWMLSKSGLDESSRPLKCGFHKTS